MDRIRIVLRLICILGCVQLLAAGVSGEIFSSDRMSGFNAVHTGDFSLVAGTTGTTLSPLLTCSTGGRAGSGEVYGGSDNHDRTMLDTYGSGPSRIGVFRNSTHLFYLDYNGNGVWNGALTDKSYNFGLTGDIPVSGDWNMDGPGNIGVFRNSTHLFYLDYNGNGTWDGAVKDRSYNFGLTGDIPVTGDWNGDDIPEIGVFRPSTHTFYLDYNGNGAWNGAVTDRSYNFGLTGDIPVTGKWNASGTWNIGVFRPSTHIFYLDYNGNGAWNGAVTDRSYNFGLTGDIPVTGDWDVNALTEIGVFRPSTHMFYLDYNGNGTWNGAVTDRRYDFGLTGDTPVPGRWY